MKTKKGQDYSIPHDAKVCDIVHILLSYWPARTMKSDYLFFPRTLTRDLGVSPPGVSAFVADALFSRGGACTWAPVGNAEEARDGQVGVVGST